MSRSTIYVYSTLSAAVVYRSFAKTDGDIPVADQGVLINGGANVVDRKSGETPAGVRTAVTPEQLDVLEKDPVFQMHKKNGYIRISEHQADAETVASDMENRDQSAQLDHGDFKEPDENKPEGGVPTPDDVKPVRGTNKRRA